MTKSLCNRNPNPNHMPDPEFFGKAPFEIAACYRSVVEWQTLLIYCIETNSLPIATEITKRFLRIGSRSRMEET